MSNKQRIKLTTQPEEQTLKYEVQGCVPGAPWRTIEVFEGLDKEDVLKRLRSQFPKAKFR